MPIGRRLARELENVHVDAERLITALFRPERTAPTTPQVIGREHRTGSESVDLASEIDG